MVRRIEQRLMLRGKVVLQRFVESIHTSGANFVLKYDRPVPPATNFDTMCWSIDSGPWMPVPSAEWGNTEVSGNIEFLRVICDAIEVIEGTDVGAVRFNVGEKVKENEI